MTAKTAHEDARDVFGRRASFYTTSAAHTDAAVLARVVESARAQPHWLAADIGTGTGHTAFAVAPHVAHVIGIDPTAEMLREASALRTSRGVSNVEFCLGVAEALPLATESVDLVTCRRAAHHFEHIDFALAEMRRVLRQGARLVIDDRSVPEDDFVEECLNRLDWYHDHSHVAQYRPSTWQDMLEKHGFAVSACEAYTRHRPLTSLTEGVAPDDAAAIHGLLAGLSEDQRTRLNLVDVGGEPYINHWFVLLSATRP